VQTAAALRLRELLVVVVFFASLALVLLVAQPAHATVSSHPVSLTAACQYEYAVPGIHANLTVSPSVATAYDWACYSSASAPHTLIGVIDVLRYCQSLGYPNATAVLTDFNSWSCTG
jgi:hypothetical protein